MIMTSRANGKLSEIVKDDEIWGQYSNMLTYKRKNKIMKNCSRDTKNYINS